MRKWIREKTTTSKKCQQCFRRWEAAVWLLTECDLSLLWFLQWLVGERNKGGGRGNQKEANWFMPLAS